MSENDPTEKFLEQYKTAKDIIMEMQFVYNHYNDVIDKETIKDNSELMQFLNNNIPYIYEDLMPLYGEYIPLGRGGRNRTNKRKNSKRKRNKTNRRR